MRKALAKRGLTPEKRLFAFEWSKDCNATHAAIRAGYTAKGTGVAVATVSRTGVVLHSSALGFELNRRI